MNELTKSELASKYPGRTADVTFRGTVRSDGAIVLNKWGDWVLYDPDAAKSITLLPESDFAEYSFDPDDSKLPAEVLSACRSIAGDLMDLLSKAEGDFIAAVSLPPPND